MMRLSRNTLKNINKQVQLPQVVNPAVGIVHLGMGAFHRGHQAVYTENAMAKCGGDWGICGVDLLGPAVKQALQSQDYLYTVAILDTDISYQIVGSVNSILVAPGEMQEILQIMALPTTHIFTVTVTEKGYCLDPQGHLNIEHPGIKQDLQSPQAPVTVIGVIVEALRQRFTAGVAPPTVISCDNLANNGHLLSGAVMEFANLVNKDLAHWIEDKVCFPCTMVDSITPAADDALREKVERDVGLTDMLPVQRESFIQWVIENKFSGPRPAWEDVGAILADDVAPYENAKLRILNATHSALAYLGSLMGIETVYQAINNQALSAYIYQLMKSEIVPGIQPVSGMDIDEYAAAILQRYKNPTIKHYLSQIAWDGSLKIPIRILKTLTENLGTGRSISLLCIAIAGWMHFVRTRAVLGQELSDPLAEELLKIGSACTLDAADDVSRFMLLEEVFNRELSQNSDFLRELTSAYQALGDGTAASVTNALNMK
jgi:fructuronate reductase